MYCLVAENAWGRMSTIPIGVVALKLPFMNHIMRIQLLLSISCLSILTEKYGSEEIYCI